MNELKIGFVLTRLKENNTQHYNLLSLNLLQKWQLQ